MSFCIERWSSYIHACYGRQRIYNIVVLCDGDAFCWQAEDRAIEANKTVNGLQKDVDRIEGLSIGWCVQYSLINYGLT